MIIYPSIKQVFEVIAIGFIVELFNSHCVRGGEYGVSIWFYIFFLPVITVHTIFLAIYRIFCGTVGLDPIVREYCWIFNSHPLKAILCSLQSIIFNLTSGIILVIATIIVLVAMVSHCGNEYAKFFYLAAVFGLLSGLMHLCNGIMCLVYLPKSELYVYQTISKIQFALALQSRSSPQLFDMVMNRNLTNLRRVK